MRSRPIRRAVSARSWLFTLSIWHSGKLGYQRIEFRLEDIDRALTSNQFRFDFLQCSGTLDHRIGVDPITQLEFVARVAPYLQFIDDDRLLAVKWDGLYRFGFHCSVVPC